MHFRTHQRSFNSQPCCHLVSQLLLPSDVIGLLPVPKWSTSEPRGGRGTSFVDLMLHLPGAPAARICLDHMFDFWKNYFSGGGGTACGRRPLCLAPPQQIGGAWGTGGLVFFEEPVTVSAVTLRRCKNTQEVC